MVKFIVQIYYFIARTIELLLKAIFFSIAFLGVIPFGIVHRAKIFRLYLQTSGGAFIKIGQLLSMRYDLLPLEYCQQLSLLLDNLPVIPFDKINQIIQHNYKKPIDKVFSNFSKNPLGSASIAQVHEATLMTGEAVVIKIMKPGIQQIFSTDFLYLSFLGAALNLTGLFGRINIKAFMTELIKLTQEEFDFRKECRNLSTMHRLMNADNIAHYAPKPYFEYCTDEIIVMEKINGISVKALIEALELGDVVTLEKWKQEEGICPLRTSRIIFRSILEQTMRYRVYQADPHAANLIVMKGGTLAWIDFGMLGWLDEKMWHSQFRLRVALSEGNLHEGYRFFASSLGPLPNKDLSVFESEIKEAFRDWVEASNDPNAGLQEKSSGYFFINVFLALRKAGLSLPSGLSRLYRAIIIADMVMLKLDPAIDWVPVMREFISDEFKRLSAERIKALSTIEGWSKWIEEIIQIPIASLRLADWINFNLPEFSNFAVNQVSIVSKLLLMVMYGIRNGLILALIYLLTIKTFDTHLLYSEIISKYLTNYWNIVVFVLIISIFASQKTLRYLNS